VNGKKRKLVKSFKVVISCDKQFFLESDLNKELIGNDTDYLKFKEVHKKKFCGEDHEKIIYFGAKLRSIQVDNKEEELAMIKRHQFYLQHFEKIGKYIVMDNPFAESMDILLFYSRFASELVVKIFCDQCEELFTGFYECRYRCLDCNDFDICQDCYDNSKNLKNHSETHKVICMRFKCRSCKGYIVGTRYNCKVCPDFDLCLGCFDREPFPASHNSSHQMTRSRNIPKDIIENEQDNVYEEYAIYDICVEGKVVEVLKE